MLNQNNLQEYFARFKYLNLYYTYISIAYILLFLISYSNSYYLPDYHLYKSTYDVLISGINPYSRGILIQTQQGFPSVIPFNNSPFSLFILSPIFSLPLEVGFKIIQLLNFICIVFIPFLMHKIFEKSKLVFLISIITIVYYAPIYQLLALGQFSLILVVSVISSLVLLKSKQDLLAGVVLGFSLIKPNVVYLVLWALLLWGLLEKRIHFLLGFTLTFSAIIISIVYTSPNIFFQWLDSLLLSKDWVGANLISAIQYNFPSNKYLYSLDWLLPILAVILITAKLLIVKTRENLNDLLMPVFCFCLITTPYAWFFDFVILIPAQIYILIKALKLSDHNYRNCIFGLFFLIHTYLLLALGYTESWKFFWIPIAYLLILYTVNSLPKKQNIYL